MRTAIRAISLSVLLTFVVQITGCGGGSSSEAAGTAPVLEQAPATAPDDSTAVPVDSTAAPVDSTAAPVDSTAAPVDSTAAPVDSTAAPVDSTAAPVPVAVPADELADGDPRQPIAVPADDPTAGDPRQPSTPPPAPPPAAPRLDGFDIVSDELWDGTAVRKVLQTFAYGGQATDSQIELWADMPPDQAIMQILTFEQHNLLLSPVGPEDYDRLDTKDGTLAGLAQFWASDVPDNGINAPDRVKYDMFAGSVAFGAGQVMARTWVRAANSRGLNPFRQKVGLWETNYHMAANRTVVPVRAMIRYYDTIMAVLEAGRPYQEVLAEAAKSAAIAIQYGHRNNVYVDGECRCNEDFAREYHQLFFGILGVNDEPFYHETVTIKNTAAALTDMNVEFGGELGGFASKVTFGTEKHTPGALEILHVSIEGINAAERIDRLSQIAIEYPESLDNLPVKIIAGLADDNLTADKINKVRRAWRAMPEKNLLDFLRAYAVSTLYHDSSRVKYRTSIDRQLLVANLVTLNNEEGYLDLYSPMPAYGADDIRAFSPTHNVFGGQTGGEASTSTTVFHNNYDRVTEREKLYSKTSGDKYGRTWEKDWGAVIPQGYSVRDIGEWLWQRFVADGLKHFGPLERAHLYAFLSTGRDLAFLLDAGNADRVITVDEVQSDPIIRSLVNDISIQTVALDSTDDAVRDAANRRVGQAINFIIGTPFLFAEEGR